MFLVINPEGRALNLAAAHELADIPPEQVDGPPRLLVTFENRDARDQYTVYDLTLDDVLHGNAREEVGCRRRWIRGARPIMPGRVPF